MNPADCSLIQGRMGRPKLPLTPGAEGLLPSISSLASGCLCVVPLPLCMAGLHSTCHHQLLVPVHCTLETSSEGSSDCSAHPDRPGSGGGVRAGREGLVCRLARGAGALCGVERAGCACMLMRMGSWGTECLALVSTGYFWTPDVCMQCCMQLASFHATLKFANTWLPVIDCIHAIDCFVVACLHVWGARKGLLCIALFMPSGQGCSEGVLCIAYFKGSPH